MKDIYGNVLLALLLVGMGVNAFLTYRVSKAVDKSRESTERLQSAVEEQTNPEWEYKCVETNRKTALREVGLDTHLDERFSDLGDQGWEMVGYAMNNGANTRFVCFKRLAD
jgi:hypothetical protein